MWFISYNHALLVYINDPRLETKMFTESPVKIAAKDEASKSHFLEKS